MANKRRTDKGEVIPPYLKDDGYLYVMVTGEDGRRQEHPVHILVAETFLGFAPSPEHRVVHKNGKLTDNAVTNLECACQGDRAQDHSRDCG